MAKKKNKVILVDSDVISHFIKGGEIYSLNSIFEYELKILDKVYNELKNNISWKRHIDNLISQKVIQMIPFPETNADIKKEYFRIKKQMNKGDGESACLSYVRYTNNIIASSNLIDIKDYCEEFEITYLTTMDFLCYALTKGIFTEQRCNDFINNVWAKNSRLSVRDINDYECRNIDI